MPQSIFDELTKPLSVWIHNVPGHSGFFRLLS